MHTASVIFVYDHTHTHIRACINRNVSGHDGARFGFEKPCKDLEEILKLEQISFSAYSAYDASSDPTTINR